MQLPGVGPTTATAMVAMIGRGQEFSCGRQLSAWLGLVPGPVQLGRQAAPGAHHQGRGPVPAHVADPGRARLSGRGQEQERCDSADGPVQLAARVGYWKAVVAIAAKNARMCWAVLARGESFKLPA